MALDIRNERGIPLDRQERDWADLVRAPYSKLDDDAFTRVRVILMNGIEAEAIRFGHACARARSDLQLPLAELRRVEQHQQSLVNGLNPPDQSPLETTIGFEQVAIEVTAAVAMREPDEYFAKLYRFGMLEDFDHLYRFAALMDRLEGKDANSILQCYTDIIPGRPTSVEHRAPVDDLRSPYDREHAHPLTKLHALTITAAEHMTHDYYMVIGPMFSDPLARQLYAEIASIEEQHVTQYESFSDPRESWLEKWLIHEATEVYNYWSCMESEPNDRVKKIWERFVEWELGHLHFVRGLFQSIENRDPAEILPDSLPDPVTFEAHRDFIRTTLDTEVNLWAMGTQLVDRSAVPQTSPTLAYQDMLNKSGSPSEQVASGYRWLAGTELARVPTAATREERSVQ